MVISFVLFLISLALFVFAPHHYDERFCTVVFIVFLIASFLLLKKFIRFNCNYFIFPVFFAISFAFVNFVYPVFLYPVNPYYFSVYKHFPFKADYISICTALALLGYSSYCLGCYSSFRKVFICNGEFPRGDKRMIRLMTAFKPESQIFTLLFIGTFIFTVLLAKGRVLSRDHMAFSDVHPALIVLNQVFLSLALILAFLSVKRKQLPKKINFVEFFLINKFLIVSVLIYIFFFLYLGDRGPAIQAIFVLLFLYSTLIAPIKLKELLIIIVIGMFILTTISYSRNSSNSFLRTASEFEFNSVADLGMDLIVNNRNLFVGYEIVQESGLNYGKSMMCFLFAPIPYLPTLISDVLFGMAPVELSTSSIITKYSQANYGLGSNVIIDLYMQFGVVGVVMFMFIFGSIITNSYLHLKSLSIYRFIIMGFFMSFSIGIPRSSLFDSIRFIVWAIVFHAVVNYITIKFQPPSFLRQKKILVK